MANPLVFGFIVMVILLGMTILIFFPEALKPSPEINVTEICIFKCKQELAAGKDLSSGPCLLNPIPEARSWVCDVAHSPRQDVDNLPENQCSAFREGNATNFVEVTPDCKLITVYEKHIFITLRRTASYYMERMVNAARKLIDRILISLGFK